MADQDWNAQDIGGGIAAIISALSGGSDTTKSPAPSVQASAFDISSALPIALVVIGGIVALKVLKVF